MGIFDKLFGKKKKGERSEKEALKVEVIDYRTDEERQMEREARAGVSLGPELDSVVAELIDIGRMEGFYGTGDKFDEDNRNKRAREIGMMLNEMGGFKLMQKVWYRVYLTLRAEGGAQCGSLERAWGYIGDWLP